MNVIATITPVTHDLGDFQVRRVLPARERIMVGPFIFVDQFGPAQLDIGKAMDVRPHPHINLATVTWLFEGAIDHRDSLGSFSTIRPGQVNLMTAGRPGWPCPMARKRSPRLSKRFPIFR
jgi:redox-sensitive bicupin YhaK (pirin superfamily)